MNEGELGIQFRLKSDYVKSDTAEAMSKVASGVQSSSGLLSSGKTFKQLSQEQRQIESILRSTKDVFVNVSKGRKQAWENMYAPLGGRYQGKPPPILTDIKAKMDLDRSKFIKDATFAMMPLFNPTSVWGNLFASRQIFSGLSQTKFGQGLVGKMGMGTGTGATALAAGGTVGVLLAVGLAIKALTKTIQESIKAYQDAPKLYAKALTSGLGLQFVSKRSIMANIMGVSEQEVIKYAYAFNYLNPKIEWASAIMAKTNTNLTSVGWGFKVIGTDMSAMFATIANDAAPAMRKFVDGLSQVIILSTEFYKTFKKPITFVGKTALQTVMQTIFGQGTTLAAKLGVKGLMGLGKDTGTAPPPISFMRQLPASSWERMGLVLGGGISANPAKETAHNTKQIAQDIKKLVSYVARGGGAPTFNLQNAP